MGGAALSFEHERAHALVDGCEIAVEELLGLVRLGRDVGTLAELEGGLLDRRQVARRSSHEPTLVLRDRKALPRQRRVDRRREPRYVLAGERGDRCHGGRVARRVAPALLDLRRADHNLVARTGQGAVRRGRQQPRLTPPGPGCLERGDRGPFVAYADQHVRVAVGPEGQLEGLHRLSPSLGGMEGCPAPREEEASGRKPPVGAHAGEPVWLGRDRRARQFAVCHEAVYSMRGAMTVFERQTLANGLRVLTAPMPQAQSVSCFVMLAAGSRYETAQSNGIAHFAEHMFFKGTDRRPTARDISAEIDAIGGEFNAFTGKEITGYYVRCAGESRDVALDVLVDMLRHSRFDPEEIEREKGVITEEMNMYFDTPRDYVSGVYDDLVYGDHPLGWDILGRKQTIRDTSRDTFLEYLDRWYTAGRMVVGVAGAVGEGLEEKLGELLGDVREGREGSPDPAPPIADGSRVKVHTKASDQAHLCLGFRTYPIDHPDRYVIDLLRVVLGGGMSSRLFTEVRERRGLAYYVLAMIQGYADTGSLFAQAGVDLKRVDEAVTTIVGEFTNIAAKPVPSDELEKARAYAKGRFVLSLETPQGMNRFGLLRETLENAHPDPREVIDGYEAVTAEDVQRVAQELIAGESLRLALVGPFDDAARFEALLP
jgi:predicted Zn-dependent peptidase